MKRMMTRKQLYEIDQEYKKYAEDCPGLYLAIQDKVKRFYEKAAHELRVTAARYKVIQDLFVQKDEMGNFITHQVEGKAEWKLIESGEALKAAGVMDISLVEQHFNDACEKLFNQTISFDW